MDPRMGIVWIPYKDRRPPPFPAIRDRSRWDKETHYPNPAVQHCTHWSTSREHPLNMQLLPIAAVALLMLLVRRCVNLFKHNNVW